MKSIRIGNDIRIVWPIVLSGDVSKLKDLDLTVEVRPSKKVVDTHNYADDIDNVDNDSSYIKSETTIMMNGGVVCRPDIGDGKEHCKPRPYLTRPIRPTDPVKLPYYIENNTLIAMWTADRQFAVGDYDIIVYAHKNGGGQAVCDQYRFVRLVPHTAQADGPDNSGIEAVITMQPLTLSLSGLSAYEVAVVNGFQGSVEEWLESLKAGKLSSYVSVESIDNLPQQGDESTGYIIGTKLYIYVGTGGDTLEGKYKDVGEFRGPQGAPGSDGKSAYELAVEGGYEGSVEEWLLSLKGRDGLDGENGKDGVTPLIRWNNNRIEQSTDNGKSWWALSDKFNNKLYIKGYVTSADKLPKNALVGDMYGVGPIYGDDDVEQTKPYYQVYVNIVTDWAKSVTITKVYQGDTELPQSAENNEIILIKKSTDNYLVYKYVNGSWNLLANLAEIYVEKDDIVNRGDNIFALVQSEIENQYELYERVVSWRNSGTFTSITAGIVNELGDSENAVMSQKAVTDAILNKIDLSAIDFDAQTIKKLALATIPTRYNVISSNKSVGIMEVFSDTNGHMVTEVFDTHYIVENGALTGGHSDDKTFRYMRSYHLVKGGTSDIPVGTWGEWKQVYSSDNAKDVETLKNDVENLNANTGIDEYETCSDQKAYSAGTTVLYNGLLYTFTTDHVAGPWNESQVESASLKKFIDINKDYINSLLEVNKYFNEICLGDGLTSEITLNGEINNKVIKAFFLKRNHKYLITNIGSGRLYPFNSYDINKDKLEQINQNFYSGTSIIFTPQKDAYYIGGINAEDTEVNIRIQAIGDNLIKDTQNNNSDILELQEKLYTKTLECELKALGNINDNVLLRKNIKKGRKYTLHNNGQARLYGVYTANEKGNIQKIYSNFIVGETVSFTAENDAIYIKANVQDSNDVDLLISEEVIGDINNIQDELSNKIDSSEFEEFKTIDYNGEDGINNNIYFDFSFEQGKTYTIKNNGPARIYDLNIGNDKIKVQDVFQNFTVGESVTFTANENCNQFWGNIQDNTKVNISVILESHGKLADIVKKPVIIFNFDQTSLDSRYTTLLKYGLPATFAFVNDYDIISTLVKKGFDICPYGGDEYGSSKVATFEKRYNSAKNDLQTTIENMNSMGLYFPVALLCRYHQYGDATEKAIQDLGYNFRYIRASQYNITQEDGSVSPDYSPYKNANGYGKYLIPLLLDNYNGYDEVIQELEKQISENSRGVIIPMMHGFSSSGGMTSSITEDDFDKIVKYVKSKKDSNEVEVMSIRQFYQYYYPNQGVEDNINRALAAIIHSPI